MAITPPNSHNRVDTGPDGVFASSAAVAAAYLQDLAENHNHLYAAMNTPLAGTAYCSGWAGGAGTPMGAGLPRDIGVAFLDQEVDENPYEIWIWADNQDVTDSATLDVLVDGSSVHSWSISASTAAAAYTYQFTPASGQHQVIVQLDRTDAHVFAWSVYRYSRTGSSVADTPKASGFCWTQPSQVALHAPVAVEHLNRMLAAPWQIYAYQPMCLASLMDCPEAPRLGISDTSTLSGQVTASESAPQGVLILSPRCDVRASIWACARKTSGGDGIVSFAIGSTPIASLTFSATAAPTAGSTYTFLQSTAFSLTPGVYPLTIDCVGAELWTVQVITEPA